MSFKQIISLKTILILTFTITIITISQAYQFPQQSKTPDNQIGGVSNIPGAQKFGHPQSGTQNSAKRGALGNPPQGEDPGFAAAYPGVITGASTSNRSNISSQTAESRPSGTNDSAESSAINHDSLANILLAAVFNGLLGIIFFEID
ncbi:hypothetical protein G9A89_014253 [Geosiphon pyriformis]|nr:hypothetical protein G9A89_014253 [Geosiphon pyriformis]